MQRRARGEAGHAGDISISIPAPSRSLGAGRTGRFGVTNKAFQEVRIDQFVRYIGLTLADGLSVRNEYPQNDGGTAGTTSS